MDKTKGVMTALKGRKGFGSKKGIALLGIVQKLTAKRKNAGSDKEEEGEVEDKKESKKQEGAEMD